MTTPSDLKTVSDFYEAVGRRDLEQLVALLAPQTAVKTRIEAYEGRDAVVEMYEETFSGSDFDLVPTGFIPLGDSIAALSTLTVRMHGMETSESLVDRWVLEDGKVGLMEVFDERDAIERLAIGVQVGNLRQVRAVGETLEEGRYSHLEEQMDPQIELDVSTRLFNEPTRVGPSEVIGFLGSLRNVWEDAEWRYSMVVAARDRVAAEVDFSARGKESGIEMHDRVSHVFSIKDGLVKRVELHSDGAGPLAELCALV